MEHAAGIFLVLVAVATLPGFMMFWLRGGHRGGPPRSRTHFIVERSSIMSGAILAAIGFVLLAGAFQNAGGVLAIIGATAYLFGAVLVVAGEALSLTVGYEKIYPITVIYVVMAFLAQAAVGGAVIQSGLLAASIGWATILWNIAWLIVLSLFSRRDMYYPILHYVMPLVMGIALLLSNP
jgi:hypothetical protein